MMSNVCQCQTKKTSNRTTANPYSPEVISLEQVDLSEISFENRILKPLPLFRSNLTRAVLVSTDISCVNFYEAILINTSFHGATVLAIKYPCFLNSPYTVFVRAKLTGASLSRAKFIATDFSEAILENAIMRHFDCLGCLFFETNIYHTDLTSSVVLSNSIFDRTNLTKSVLVSAAFTSTTFRSTKFTQIR